MKVSVEMAVHLLFVLVQLALSVCHLWIELPDGHWDPSKSIFLIWYAIEVVEGITQVITLARALPVQVRQVEKE